MAKKVKFPEIQNEMDKRGETRKDLARILQLDESQITRKLNGKVQWTFSDIEVLCLHYCKDFYELFRKEMNQ